MQQPAVGADSRGAVAEGEVAAPDAGAQSIPLDSRSRRGPTVVDSITAAQMQAAIHPREGAVALLGGPGDPEAPMNVSISRRVAEALLGTTLESAKRGQGGKVLTSNVTIIEAPRPARNVVAILPGSDPKLNGEYVAIGAHNDHIGIRPGAPLDHDSVRIYNAILRTQGLENRTPLTPTPAQAVALKAALDSVPQGARRSSRFPSATAQTTMAPAP